MKAASHDEGSAEEESAESPEVEQKEQEDGTEGVVIPEEFQSKVHELLKGADKHHLSHMRDRIYAKEDELRQEEAKKNSKNKKSNKPEPTGTMAVDSALEN